MLNSLVNLSNAPCRDGPLSVTTSPMAPYLSKICSRKKVAMFFELSLGRALPSVIPEMSSQHKIIQFIP